MIPNLLPNIRLNLKRKKNIINRKKKQNKIKLTSLRRTWILIQQSWNPVGKALKSARASSEPTPTLGVDGFVEFQTYPRRGSGP